MKIAFSLLLAIHGTIHLLGFVKSIAPEKVPQLTLPISKNKGMMWLAAALLFDVSLVFLWVPLPGRFFIPAAAAVFSQYLIAGSFKDAKFGSIPNVIILLVCIFAFTTGSLKRQYETDVKQLFSEYKRTAPVLITEDMIKDLPLPVRKYLSVTGAIGKPITRNMRVVFKGSMRGKDKSPFSFVSEQINFFEYPSRSFYMEGDFSGITVPGYHNYVRGKASMQIKPLGFIPVVDLQSAELDKGETVTLLNDLCLMAPGAMVLPQLQYEALDSVSAKVIYTVGSIKVSAVLHFDSSGQLINFTSNDRYETNDKQWYPFETPLRAYKTFPNGYTLASEGDAVWVYPAGKFSYGLFYLQSVEYNTEK